MTETTPPESPVFPTVAVLGAGTMGAGIAQVCAAAGCVVRLHDRGGEFIERGLAGITKFLDKGVERGKTTPEVRAETLARISGAEQLGAAVADAHLVIEAVPEDLGLKQTMFGQVVEHVDAECVLATNTSSLSIADVFDGVPHAGRCLGMHFFNPVHIMKLVEVVRGNGSSDEAVAMTVELAERMGTPAYLIDEAAPLTGPLVRNDQSTINAHLACLDETEQSLYHVFISLYKTFEEEKT